MTTQRPAETRPAEAAKHEGGRVGVTRVRVRYAETDRMGVVYYANYLVWFEVARTNWLRDTGWSYRAMEADGTSLPVIEAHCEYRRAAHYDDEIDIHTRATLMSPVRIRFDYDVMRPDEPMPLASGYTVHAAVDPSGRPCRLPGRVRTILEAGPSEQTRPASTIQG
jgi:acyl-CoA thioester hydrolase